MNVLDLYRARLGEPKVKGSGSRGKEYCGPCPGCGGKDRFVMWPDAQGTGGGYTCRSCGSGGDALQFLMDFDNLTFPRACDKLGVKLDPKAPTTPRLPRSLAPERFTPRVIEAPADVWRAKAQILADHAHELLLKTPAQLEWLAARGITEATAVEHRLGWIAKDYCRAREAWGLETVLKDNGQPKKLWIPQGLTIPYSVSGQLRRVRIRKWVVRDADDPRYLVLPTAPAGAGMDTWLSREGAPVYVVVESELDGVLVAQEAGDLVGVVALGSAKTKPDERSAKSLAGAGLILVALDYDRAGAEAFWSAPKNQPELGGWWPRNFPNSARWMVPMGKDPGEYVADHGGCVRSWVLSGLPPSVTVGLSRFGGGLVGNGTQEGVAAHESPAVTAWREFVRLRGGNVRFVRFELDGGPTFDLDWRPDPSGRDLTEGAAELLEALGGWDGALASGLVADVAYGALWRGY